MASGSIASGQIDGETVKTVANFILGGAPKSLKMVTESKKLGHLLFGRKAMTNLESILKSREGMVLRWQRNRNGRPLSPLQINQEYLNAE